MQEALYLLIICLALFSAFNFLLTLKLGNIVSELSLALPGEHSPLIGRQLPPIKARAIATSRVVEIQAKTNSAFAIIFIAPACPKCVAKIPEIVKLTEEARRLSLTIWVVCTATRRQSKRFLNQTPLLDYAITLPEDIRKVVNPSNISPYYVFLEQDLKILATGMLGDQNWDSFKDQVSSQT